VWRHDAPSMAVCRTCELKIRKGDRYVLVSTGTQPGLWHEACHLTPVDELRREWNRKLAAEGQKVITGTVRHPRELRYRRHTRGT